MSIAALKRKTMNGNPRISPLSGHGPLGFALNGTLRVNGSVGKTNLGASNYSSINRGHSSNSCCLNDDNIIKKSVMNTKAMLSARAKGLPQGNLTNNDRACSQKCPQIWVQAIDNGIYQSNTAGQHIQKIKDNLFTRNSWNPNNNNRVKVPDGYGGSLWIETKYVCGLESVDSEGNPTYKKHCDQEPYIPSWDTTCDGFGPGPLINKSGKGRLVSGRALAHGCCSKVLPTNKASVKSGAAMSQGEYVNTRYLTRTGTPKSNNIVDQNPLPQGKICYNSNTWIGCSKSTIYTVEQQINQLGYTPPHFPPNVNNRHCAIKYTDVVSALEAGLYNEVGCNGS